MHFCIRDTGQWHNIDVQFKQAILSGWNLSILQVFLYDGSKSCTGWELGVLGLISLAVMTLLVVPAPFVVGYICLKHPLVSLCLSVLPHVLYK